MNATEEKETRQDVKIPGSLSLWQGAGVGAGSALLASIMGVNTLLERSASDQRAIAEMRGELRTLAQQVHTMREEMARYGERINALQATNGNAAGLRERTR